jgi:gamma-glutamyl:cysteine ligase YbdK (ATP-grasp superfamily)
MSEATPLHVFEGCGLELEYMIVDRETLDIRPIADELLRAPDGSWATDRERGAFGWSNELATHLIEVKSNDPRQPLATLPAGFAAELAEINRVLSSMNARLMPGAIHPWMNPATETRLWPHEYAEIYALYDRIFGCRRHGWANLQSMHVNLPFSGDEEFARLHAVIRLLLPILPALAASSPIAEGQPTGWLDYRMACYRTNSERIPSMTGLVIPEPVASEAEYRSRILAPMYEAIAPHDPQGVLQDEWLNARGAIARFDRSAIEIRVIDTQECPRADVAIAAATVAVLRRWYDGDVGQRELETPMDTRRLASLLETCSRGAGPATISDADYLQRLGYPSGHCTASELWRYLLGETLLGRPGGGDSEWREPLELILSQGTLARRIMTAVGEDYGRDSLRRVYRQLTRCLQRGELFRP